MKNKVTDLIWFKAAVVVVMATMTLTMVGCRDSRVKQLELENSELRESMKEKAELLSQAKTTKERLSDSIRDCHVKLATLQIEMRELELANIELKKNLDFNITRANKLEKELAGKRELIAGYKKRIAELSVSEAELINEVKK